MSRWITIDEMQEKGWDVVSPLHFLNRATPEMVAKLFEWNASGITQRDLPEKFQSAYSFTGTPSLFNSLLKRVDRFANEHWLYAKVDSTHAEKVAGRFWTKSAGRRRPAQKPKREQLMYAALQARGAWLDAKAAVMADGVSEQTLMAWIDITREVEL